MSSPPISGSNGGAGSLCLIPVSTVTGMKTHYRLYNTGKATYCFVKASLKYKFVLYGVPKTLHTGLERTPVDFPKMLRKETKRLEIISSSHAESGVVKKGILMTLALHMSNKSHYNGEQHTASESCGYAQRTHLITENNFTNSQLQPQRAIIPCS